MALIWQLIALISVWLVYGVLASLVINKGKRNYKLLLLSGIIGGVAGGALANYISVPNNIWYLSELIKFVITTLSLSILTNLVKS
tara:strand:- start:1507 stop:1761 length:255 start_codon:yes stop_codon:yes gene_type:complete